MNIAIYSRKSKFTGKGESIDNQIQLCKEYAQKYINGTHNYIIFEDEGFTGANTNRPEFQKLLDNIKAKQFDALICYRLDRISRNISDFADTIKILEKYNVQFVSIKEQFDTSTPMGRAMMYISSVFAQLERETIAERIKDNMYELAKTGRWLGGTTPYGYNSKKIDFVDSKGNNRSLYMLEKNKEESNLIVEFYNKYLELGNLFNLVNYIKKKGYKTRKNTSFSNINRTLCNPVYAIPDKTLYDWFSKQGSEIACTKEEFLSAKGIIAYGKQYDKENGRGYFKLPKEWLIAISEHEGTVSSKIWINTFEKMKGNKKYPQHAKGKVGMLIPILKCKCGSQMILRYGSHNSKKRLIESATFYYVCNRRSKCHGIDCKIKPANGKKADSEIINFINKMEVDMRELKTYFKKNIKLIDNEMEVIIKLENRLKKEITTYEKNIKNLMNKLSNTTEKNISKYILEAINEIDMELKKSKNQLLNLNMEKDKIPAIDMQIDNIISNIGSVLTEFEYLNIQQKKEMINILFKSIIWDGESLTVEFM